MRDNRLKIQFMYEQGLAFLQCADKCYPSEESSPWEMVTHSKVSSVNSAIACEIFLKALLEYYDVEYKKTHNLKELFGLLPEFDQGIIKNRMIDRYGSWCDSLEISYLDRIGDTFVTWRYSYEIDNAKLYCSFLICFRNVLQAVLQGLL